MKSTAAEFLGASHILKTVKYCNFRQIQLSLYFLMNLISLYNLEYYIMLI